MIHTIQFVGSYPSVDACPQTRRPEFAFIGRSNVGKSSLINLIADRKKLARVSKQPGKTQMLNFILVNETWHLVDLPGYGYAKESKKKRKSWDHMVREYLTKSPNLMCAFVLVDGSIPPQQIDIDFMNWIGENGIPCAIVYTKIDKLKPAKLKENLKQIELSFLKSWEYLPKQFLISSVAKQGREELLQYIVEIVDNQE
ncbi:MAG: ribosome biogenesis GTP-binding protein YihA/YsxC [Saprospiraceae bacterium]|nr:ribosome biogenesis GTP-binding protein YihA/YsxC [Saprospiraceae bacterium]